MRHLYARFPARVKKNPPVHIFTRYTPHFCTNHISLPSCILPLRDNKNGGTTFSLVAKAIAFECWLSEASFSGATFLRIARKQMYKANSWKIEKLDYPLSLYPSLTKSSECRLDRKKLRKRGIARFPSDTDFASFFLLTLLIFLYYPRNDEDETFFPLRATS